MLCEGTHNKMPHTTQNAVQAQYTVQNAVKYFHEAGYDYHVTLKIRLSIRNKLWNKKI